MELQSGSGDVFDDRTCPPPASGSDDLSNTNAELVGGASPQLTANGGPTDTIALQTSATPSPAIGNVPSTFVRRLRPARRPAPPGGRNRTAMPAPTRPERDAPVVSTGTASSVDATDEHFAGTVAANGESTFYEVPSTRTDDDYSSGSGYDQRRPVCTRPAPRADPPWEESCRGRRPDSGHRVRLPDPPPPTTAGTTYGSNAQFTTAASSGGGGGGGSSTPERGHRRHRRSHRPGGDPARDRRPCRARAASTSSTGARAGGGPREQHDFRIGGLGATPSRPAPYLSGLTGGTGVQLPDQGHLRRDRV